MRVIVCVDELGGMMFNHRRQSRDRTVTEDVIASLGDGALYLAPYSEKLFADTGVSYTVDDRFLALAKKGDTCFVEDRHLAEWVDRIDELILYHWNRRYPSDLRLDLSVSELGFRLRESREWQGTSHEKITKEVYVK